MRHRLLPIALLAACSAQEIQRPNPPPEPPHAELWPLGGLIYYNTPLPEDHHSKQPRNNDGTLLQPGDEPAPDAEDVTEEAEPTAEDPVEDAEPAPPAEAPAPATEEEAPADEE